MKRRASVIDASRGIDVRAHPERYVVGRGEEGVLTVEPYKHELLPLWRFRTPSLARASAAALYAAFLAYAKSDDFVGMDMARKFLQMGYTRARRYANHRSGRKYDARGEVLPADGDPEKAASAEEFFSIWKKAEIHPKYARWKRARLDAERETRAPRRTK